MRDTAKDKCTPASKASSNFSNEEYRKSFRIKWRGVPPSPTLWWASCYAFTLCSDNSKMLSSIPVAQKQLRGFLGGLGAGCVQKWGPFAWRAVTPENVLHFLLFAMSVFGA